jgi:hypothetical protein
MPTSPIASQFERPFSRRRPFALPLATVVGFADLCSPKRCSAQVATSNIPVGTFPYGIAVNEVTNRIYVNNAGGNSVSATDDSTGSVSTAARLLFSTNQRVLNIFYEQNLLNSPRLNAFEVFFA